MTRGERGRPRRRAAAIVAAGVAWVAFAALAASAVAAWGQTLDVERPETLVVGTPRRGAPIDRIDAARTGLSPTALPTSNLRSLWRTTTGVLVEQSPLVDARGDTFILGTRGEVVALGHDGAERWRVPTNAMRPGPPVLLANGTLVFVDSAGEAVAVREGKLAWRVRFGRGDSAHAASLPLADGGVIVATTRELVVLDADGHERARTTLPEATTAPLVATMGKVVAVTVSGAVWTWSPGAAEATRVANFGSAIDGSAALGSDRTLLAVTAGQTHLTAVDLVAGTVTTRAVSPGGLWLGPPAMRGGTAYVTALAPTSELALAIDASGREIARAMLAPHAQPPSADGGAGALFAPAHDAPLVDAAGTLAFATLDGGVGVVASMGAAPRPSPSSPGLAPRGGGSVELLPDACAPVAAVASSEAGGAPAARLAPLEAGTFVVACHSGTVLAVGGGPAGDANLPHL